MSYEELLKNIKIARENQKTIGLVQGSWDLFHIGHLRYILKARALCDYLVIAMDSDEKIKKRKGNSRPVIPENERYDFIELLNIADAIVIKQLKEPKWNLIRMIQPDVLIAIKDNYSDEEIKELEQICGRVAILPRQSESSTSDKIRKIMISNHGIQINEMNEQLSQSIEELKKRIGYNENMPVPVIKMVEGLKGSTDSICPTAAACFINNQWYVGVNQIDLNVSKYDITERTELLYDTIEHAEINLLKKLGPIKEINVPIWTTLFPCDRCMKVLIHKGVKEIYYLEDHPNRNWSKRSHELAEKFGIKTISLLEKNQQQIIAQCHQDIDMQAFNYIYPPNSRHQEQLDIMMDMERNQKDPLDPQYIEQEILFMTDYWHVSYNKFPYEGTEKQFLIVSRYPIYHLEDMSKEMWQDLQKVWQVLISKYQMSGGALAFRYGDPARSGATLKRLHAHVIMPLENNKVKFTIGGKNELKRGLYLKKDEE